MAAANAQSQNLSVSSARCRLRDPCVQSGGQEIQLAGFIRQGKTSGNCFKTRPVGQDR